MAEISALKRYDKPRVPGACRSVSMHLFPPLVTYHTLTKATLQSIDGEEQQQRTLMAGVALSFTRSLGEFGAVIFIAGNIAWKTEVTSLMIFVRLQEFDYPAASAIASVIPRSSSARSLPSSRRYPRR